MKLIELYENSLEVKWAVGPNRSKASQDSIAREHNLELMVYYVDIEKLLSMMSDDTAINIHTGEGQIGERIDRAKEHWKQGGYMDPPVVGYNPYTNPPSFDIDDGRHRLIAAHQLGERKAPVLGQKDYADEFKKIM